MQIVYIAHPIGGDVARNVALVEDRCRLIYQDKPDVIPLAPYLMALRYLNDAVPEDRLRGTAGNKEFFDRKVMDEVWLFGDRISHGMWEEVLWSRSLGIRVRPMSKRVHLDLIRHELKVGDQVSVLCCGPSTPCICTYLGEMENGQGLRVIAPIGETDIWWGEIVRFEPAQYTLIECWY